jgi:hypothetical protein
MKPSIQRFIDEYLLDHNGADAARRAGYAAAGAKQRAHVLLSRPEVVAAISNRHYERRAREGLQVDEIITDLSTIARSAGSVPQRLRAYALVMRYYGMLTGKRPPTGEAPDDVVSNHIIHLRDGLESAGKPVLDDEDDDLESLEALIANDLAEPAADQAPPQSDAHAPTPAAPAPTAQPDPDANLATNAKPAPPPAPDHPGNPDPHRAGPDPNGSPVKPAPPNPAPMPPIPANHAPAAATRSMASVSPRPPRPSRPDPAEIAARIKASQERADARFYAVINNLQTSTHAGKDDPARGHSKSSFPPGPPTRATPQNSTTP